MENAPTLELDKEQAKALYGEYLEAVKTRKEKYVEELKKVYYHLSQGHKVIDIYEVFKKSGVNEHGEPKLAIVRADSRKAVFHKRELGAGRFSENLDWRDKTMGPRFDVELPTGTFPNWATEKTDDKWNPTRIVRQNITAKTPIVPAHLLPEGKLDNYYILFEVTEWNEVPVAADPFLLKRINSNAFVVLAEWDVTPFELAIMRGD